MVNFIEELVVGSTPAGRLTVQERNLLSVVCKNMISSLLAAWRIVSSIEQKEVSRKNEDLVVLVKDYRSKVESRDRALTGFCWDFEVARLESSAFDVNERVESVLSEHGEAEGFE
ncbi:14-3-3-like protein G-BOX factor 14 kappa [Sarracenia purpurea var. burkii]